MATIKAETPALRPGAHIIHQTGAPGILLRYPDDAPNSIDAFNLSTGLARRWRNGEYSADSSPLPSQVPAPVFVVNAGSGVKISAIMGGVLTANLITVIAASLLCAAMR